MATKKQKRARVATKRAAFMAEVRRTGLEAQATDIRKREARAAQKKAQQDAIAVQQAAEKRAEERRKLEAVFGPDLQIQHLLPMAKANKPDATPRALAIEVGRLANILGLELESATPIEENV